MKKGLVILFAYLATLALVPLPFVGALYFWVTPFHGEAQIGTLVQPYNQLAFGGLLASLPGFTLTRLILGSSEERPAFAFSAAGAATGMLAAVFVSLPDNFWILWKYFLFPIGAVIGALAGLIYRQIETAIFKRFPVAGNTLNTGANGK